MALRETAKQFSQLCAEDAWSKLRMSPRIALHCVYGLPHLQQLALVQRAQALAESLRDEEMHLEIAHCAEHGRCRQLRRGAVTRAQRRVNPGLADGGDRHAWTCDDHHPELLTAMTLALYCAAARGRAAAWQLEGCPALMRLARSKEVRVLLAVVLNEDPVAASSAAKALGLLGSHPRARDVAVPALVHALLAGADHELPHGARALQARRSAACGPPAWAVDYGESPSPRTPTPTCPPPAPRRAAPLPPPAARRPHPVLPSQPHHAPQEMARRHAEAIGAMLAAGAIPALVSLLRGESDRSKRNAAAALKSLAKRDEGAARAMVASGGVPALVALLQAGSSAVRLRSTAVLRSLVRHVPEVRLGLGLG